MGHWTDTGFVTKTVDEYKADIQAAFIRAYGSDFSLDDTTPQGILIQGLAEMLYNTDMDGVEAFSRMNLNSVGGVLLDVLGLQRGVTRLPGRPQIATVAVTCNDSNFEPFTLSVGTRFGAIGSQDYFVTSSIKNVTSVNDTVVVDFYQYGDSSCSVGDRLSVDGYNQITNAEIVALVPGQVGESDLEFRRRLQVEYPVAQGTIEYVENKIYETGLVSDIGANYNDTDETVGTLPPYTTEWMAVPEEGADETAFKTRVAEAIINNKTPGAPTAGNTTVQVTDVFGTQKTVNFTIPDRIDLEIQVKVVPPEGVGILNLSEVPNIQIAVKDYINGLKIGRDVSYARCISPIAANQEFDIEWFKIRKKAAEGEEPEAWTTNANYLIGVREYAHIEAEDIKVGA